jgi:formylglycine-generating enzyme required for sulfatase activity
MHGNVWEWCHDDQRPYSAEDVVDPEYISHDSRAARGGSFFDYPKNCRSAIRRMFSPGDRVNRRGCRVLLALH